MTMVTCLMMVGNGIRPQAASAQQGRSLAKRLLCADCGNSRADFSPNGHWMVFVDFSTRDSRFAICPRGGQAAPWRIPGTLRLDFPSVSRSAANRLSLERDGRIRAPNYG